MRSFEEPITICQSPRRDILDLKLRSYTVLYVKTTLNAIKTHSHHLQDKPLKKCALKRKVRRSRTYDFGHKSLDPRVTAVFWETNRSSVSARNSIYFMDPDSSPPCSQEPAICPLCWARSIQSPILFIENPCLYYPSVFSCAFQVVSFFRFTHQHSVCTYSLLHTLPMPHHLRLQHINSGTW